jgi:DNA-binding CsgD family transcriptional regulator
MFVLGDVATVVSAPSGWSGTRQPEGNGMSLNTLDPVTADAGETTQRRGARLRVGAPVDGWEALTRAERRVAALVAEGLTNAQVGERIFLSRHTVDFHLRQIFRKLDVHSRVGMTRVVLGFES